MMSAPSTTAKDGDAPNKPSPEAVEADLDDRHHALGRPVGPQVTPYRNRYVLDVDCDQARRMRASDAWKQIGTMNRGTDAVFSVSEMGIREVWAWLAAKDRQSGLKLYRVSASGLSTRFIRAKSRSAARYRAYIAADFSTITFGAYVAEFCPRAVLA